MLVLITYDVAVSSPKGSKRLRRVAKACEDYGQRVQQSVFECHLDGALLAQLRDRLLQEIDPQLDSLRFYVLDARQVDRIEHYGVRPSEDMEEGLIL